MGVMDDCMLPYFVAAFRRRNRAAMADWLHSGLKLTPEFRKYLAHVVAGSEALPPLEHGGQKKRYWQRLADNEPLLYAADQVRRMRREHRKTTGKRAYAKRGEDDPMPAAAIAATMAKYGTAPSMNALTEELRRSPWHRRRKK